MGRFAVAFLDRDGTINRGAPEGEYVERPEELELLPGAGAAVRRLNDAGMRVVVVTNQRGVALGRMTLADLDAVHAELRRQLAAHGARLDGIYACPHAEDACDCRKPRPGLLARATAELELPAPERAVTIGDTQRDVLAGRAFGTATVLVGGPPAPGDARPDHVAPSLADAVAWALAA
jgi:D-glycero-D-manno-heptose 1,7-bisphosphate phosphatase